MRKIKKLVTTIIILGVLIVAVTLLARGEAFYTPDGSITATELNEAYELLNGSLLTERYTYIDYLSDHQSQIDYGLDHTEPTMLTSIGALTDDITGDLALTIGKNETASYEANLLEAGYYHISLDYRVETVTLNQITVAVMVNDTFQYDDAATIDIPLTWVDETKDFDTDRYGDEVVPAQQTLNTWTTTSLFNNTYLSVDPLIFYFESGVNTIEITNASSTPIKLGKLELVSPKSRKTYEQYYDDLVTQYPMASEVSQKIDVDAISYSEKNSSFVQMANMNSASVAPFDAVYRKINVLNGLSWLNSGQSVTYEINADKSGYYELSFHYQNTKLEFSVFRSIAIDGVIPFKEVEAYEFKRTSSQSWQNETLSDDDGNPYLFYLSKGNHQVTLRAESQPVELGARYVQLVVDHINKFSLDIRKITGKEVDKERTWNFSIYIPETLSYLEAYETLLKKAIDELSIYSDKAESSTTLSSIQKALYRIDNIKEDYERIPLYLDDFIGGTGSVTQYLGDSMTSIRQQPLYLDDFTFHGSDISLDRANANFFTRTWAGIRSFFASFTSNKYKLTKEENVIDVWVNRPITYIDIMQKMVDQTFTADTGVRVKISVMPDPNKLIMASAADQQPDVALGLASYMPYDLAIRNAAYELTSFPDYWEFASQFAPGAFVPYILNDKSYALPETLDFNVVMYRKDIFDSLGFLVPDTWDEVIQILPELQQYGMNFYHPIAGGVAIKWFYQTSGFIYQFGGDLYTTDGQRTTIATPEATEGLTFLTKLFTNYSLPEQVQSFYNSFRYATLPIGISDFATYLLIKNAAPELVGQWAIAPYPSITTHGVENRYYIANGTAGVILKETDQPDDSWAFLKWWMSTQTQAQFAFNLQSTYGPTYTWLSGNINAFEQSPFPEDDKEIILEQIKWLIDVPRTPGQYMLERSLSDIWNTAVFDGTPTGIAIDDYTIQINREVRKKMIEFGFVDKEGNILEPYIIRDIAWVKEQMAEANN